MDAQAEIEGYPGPYEVAPGIVDTADALERIPEVYGQPDPATLAKLPKGGAQLDYMGHADVTLALIAIDPYWDWAPAGTNPDGTPVIIEGIGSNGGKLRVMWGTLTVLGVTRRCVGTCEAGKPEPEKELIGDLLRNGAMRFGIATKLWSKAERENFASTQGQRPAQRQARPAAQRQDEAPPPPDDPPPPADPIAKERRRMRALLKNLGDNVPRETMLSIAGSSAGRTIASSNELSLDELRRFCGELDGLEKGTHELIPVAGSDDLVIVAVTA